MKKYILAIFIVLVFATSGWCAYTSYESGQVSYGAGMDATGAWADPLPPPATILRWDILYNPDDSLFMYNYLFTPATTSSGGGISHLIVQVSATFTVSNILTGTTPGWTIDTWGPAQGGSNPGLPDTYGLKWNQETGSLTIVTDRAPMDGTFYAKGGQTYALSSSVRVPDTQSGPPVPEPSTMLLLGMGLAGIAGFARKRYAL